MVTERVATGRVVRMVERDLMTRIRQCELRGVKESRVVVPEVRSAGWYARESSEVKELLALVQAYDFSLRVGAS